MSTQAHNAVPRASLLGMPLELREQIYQHYFQVDGGYVYDGNSEKLVQANGQPISLSLRSTCRSIAYETGHYPFTLNTIKFSTVYREDWWKQTWGLEWIIGFHNTLKRELLVRLRRLVTQDMYDHPSPEHQRYMHVIRNHIRYHLDFEARRPDVDPVMFRDSLSDKADGVRSSSFAHHDRLGNIVDCHSSMKVTNGRSFYDDSILFCHALAYVLQLVAKKHPEEFAEAIEEVLPDWTASHSNLEFFGLTFQPWAIPSLSEVMKVADHLQLTDTMNNRKEWVQVDIPNFRRQGPKHRYRQRYYFSATAIAIQFLGRISEHQRLSLRNIILNEDRVSVSGPEYHCLGLIPYCIENPALHFEHRINLWRNTLLQIERCFGDPISVSVECEEAPRDDDEDDDDDYDPQLPHQVDSGSLSRLFIRSCVGILESLKQGMPAKSYTFFLDGEPDLNHSTHMFSTIIKPAIAWLTLYTECASEGVFAPNNHPDYPFMTRTSAQGIAPVHERSSLIQCNFTLDQPWDFEKIVEETNVIDDEYAGSRFSGDLYFFDMATPALDLLKLKLENIDRERLTEDEPTEQV